MRLNSPLELQSRLSSQSYALESNPFTEITPNVSSDILERFLALREMNSQAALKSVGTYFGNIQQQQQQQTSPPRLPLLLNHNPASNLMILPAQTQTQTQTQTQNQYLLIPTSNISIAQTSTSNSTTPQIIILHSNVGTAPQLITPINHQVQTLQLSQLLNSQQNNIAQNLGGYSIIRQAPAENNIGNYYNSLLQNSYNHNHNGGLQSVHLVNDPNKLNTTIQQLLNLQDISHQNHGGRLLQSNNHTFLSGGGSYFSSRNSHFTG